MDIVQAQGLKKYYGQGENLVKALDGVSLRLRQGSFTAIVGSSGSGKTTLLHLLGGLDTPTEGTVTVAGCRLNDMTADQLTVFRRRQIGFVFQSYNLVPMLTVRENILLPIRLDGAQPDEEFIARVEGLLGLADKAGRMPATLSGGQQQRVAIARALAAKPALVLADEPTGNLDSKNSLEVLGLLKAGGRQLGQTIVMITHNQELAQLADDILRIEDGRLTGQGR